MRTWAQAFPGEDGRTLIVANCDRCGEVHNFKVLTSHYEQWEAGELIQRALPELDKDQRELLISGICGKCFAKMFRGEQ